MSGRWAYVAAALPLVAAAGVPHKVVRNTDELEFSYVWPAEAVAIPALDLRFYTEAKRLLARSQNIALGDQKIAQQDKRDFHSHFRSIEWATEGQSVRLLSLEASIGSFTGGAHPNSSASALLWDRRANRAIAVSALFLKPASFEALTRKPYCVALDKERLEKREGEKLEGMFSDCPKYAELAIAPADGNKNGRFETLRFVAGPYVAGPYVEGEYEVTLPVTSQMIAAIRPEFRASFERQRQ